MRKPEKQNNMVVVTNCVFSTFHKQNIKPNKCKHFIIKTNYKKSLNTKKN